MPVLERAQLSITPGQEQEFEVAMRDRGLDVLRSAPGCRGVELRRGIERPDTYVLLVQWDSVEAHTCFTQQPEFAGLVTVLRAHLGGPSDVQHYGPPVA